jgi:TIR domain
MARRRCFISAQYGIDLSVLQRALERNEVDWQWAQEVTAGVSLMDSISAAINSADFLLAIVSDDSISPNVALEIGYALGRGVPVILLTTGPFAIPFDFSVFRHLRTDLRDPKLLAFQIGLLLRSLETTSRAKRPTAPHLSTPEGLAIDKPAPKIFGSALEQVVAAAIISAGGRVTVPNISSEEQAADLLMWLPEIDKDFFNPAAIEAKKTIGLEDLPNRQIRLGQFVRSSGFGCGLIVVNSVALARRLSQIAPFPYVFLISLPDFKDKLMKGELGSWIRKERNRLAHGAR